MAFRMNKPVIQGTTKHSALLAKAEQVRTHGGDPSLVEASALYGASNSPNVIDYKIKQSKIKWDEDKKKKDVNVNVNVGDGVEVEKVDTLGPEELDVNLQTDPITRISTIPMEELTVNERKIEIAKVDEEAAKKRLDDAARKRYESIETTKIDPKEVQPIKTELKENIILPKKREKIEVITSEPPKVQSIGGKSVTNLKDSYTAEEQTRLIFSEEHERYVLPEEIGIKPDVIIDKSTIEKQDKRKLNKAEEGKSQQRRNVALERKYKTSSAHIQAQMRRRNPNYPWPK